jgi:hypothetical protein
MSISSQPEESGVRAPEFRYLLELESGELT